MSAFNVPLLASFCASTEQDDQRVAISAEVDSVAWTDVYAALQHPAANASDVGEVENRPLMDG